EDYDSAGIFLSRSERLSPGDPITAKLRVKLDMRSPGLGRSFRLVERMLATNAADSWAITMRSNVLRRIDLLVDSTHKSLNTNR
ncbi:MAG: hypothetical protein QOF48_1433, partial [Verrucomicrobiota bacterium]